MIFFSQHPNWGDGVTPGFSPHDVAVVALESPVAGIDISPVGLNRTRIIEGEGFVAGWGRHCK